MMKKSPQINSHIPPRLSAFSRLPPVCDLNGEQSQAFLKAFPCFSRAAPFRWPQPVQISKHHFLWYAMITHPENTRSVQGPDCRLSTIFVTSFQNLRGSMLDQCVTTVQRIVGGWMVGLREASRIARSVSRHINHLQELARKQRVRILAWLLHHNCDLCLSVRNLFHRFTRGEGFTTRMETAESSRDRSSNLQSCLCRKGFENQHYGPRARVCPCSLARISPCAADSTKQVEPLMPCCQEGPVSDPLLTFWK